MNTLLEIFISESRDILQRISQKLLQLEREPENLDIIKELFRFVHTLKGNSGLFSFPEMTKVLHASEDLMDEVRNGRVEFTQGLADQLLDAMDFISYLCGEIESEKELDPSLSSDSHLLVQALRTLIPKKTSEIVSTSENIAKASVKESGISSVNILDSTFSIQEIILKIPELNRMEIFKMVLEGLPLHVISYAPEYGCFYQGDDPFHLARQTPSIQWRRIKTREAWPLIQDLDAYRCVLDFQLLSTATQSELSKHYRFVLDQVVLVPLTPAELVLPTGGAVDYLLYENDVNEVYRLWELNDLNTLLDIAQIILGKISSEFWLSSSLRWLVFLLECKKVNNLVIEPLIESILNQNSPAWCGENDIKQKNELIVESAKVVGNVTGDSQKALDEILAVQKQILIMNDNSQLLEGRLKSVAEVLINCFIYLGYEMVKREVYEALELSILQKNGQPLLSWLNLTTEQTKIADSQPIDNEKEFVEVVKDPVMFGRRSDQTSVGSKTLKVDQEKIDCLMDLIGELVVAKNAIPYLEVRAESQVGSREIAREIKTMYGVINRITEEMQHAIMKVRMLPVSFVFQRFPRLVREISRKLGKDVELVLQGEETEADKNVIESLSEPLIHIIRNCLDHGLETPDVRKANGKSPTGKLTIRAKQEGDKAVIEIIDDGRGIDPIAVKNKALSIGLIDQKFHEQLSDQDAINLIFTAGFSTADVVSDISGRGVGMDVVRTAVQKVNGTTSIQSTIGEGTNICINIPLSMAITPIMIIETDKQFFGIPMENVVETVRLPKTQIKTIKQSQTTVMRGRILPLKSLNGLLCIPAEQLVNPNEELAVIVVSAGDEELGLVVDNFSGTIDVIQKPFVGVLEGLSVYSGSALMGDGSVLMIINIREIYNVN